MNRAITKKWKKYDHNIQREISNNVRVVTNKDDIIILKRKIKILEKIIKQLVNTYEIHSKSFVNPL